MANNTRETIIVPNTELYNRWAEVYDTDGNALQAIDELEIPSLLSQAISELQSLHEIRVVDLGCGTGRNTAKLLVPPLSSRISRVIGLDASDGMLTTARQRCEQICPSETMEVQFEVFDVLVSSSPPAIAVGADMVISTLVLEHLPLDRFFSAVAKILTPGGVLVLSNMHAEMGRKGQARFVDPRTGIKVQGTSFVYEVEEVLEAAKTWGFEVVGRFRERSIEDEDIKVTGLRGRKWLSCKVWFGGILRLQS